MKDEDRLFLRVECQLINVEGVSYLEKLPFYNSHMIIDLSKNHQWI